MKKALIAALTIVSLTCAQAHAETAAPKKKPVAAKKAANSKATNSKVATKKPSTSKTAARKSNIKQASVQRDRIVGDLPLVAMDQLVLRVVDVGPDAQPAVRPVLAQAAVGTQVAGDIRRRGIGRGIVHRNDENPDGGELGGLLRVLEEVAELFGAVPVGGRVEDETPLLERRPVL